MDTTASVEEIPMDTGGTNAATGGAAESGLTGVGGELSSSPDFPWPFSSGKSSTEGEEESSRSAVS